MKNYCQKFQSNSYNSETLTGVRTFGHFQSFLAKFGIWLKTPLINHGSLTGLRSSTLLVFTSQIPFSRSQRIDSPLPPPPPPHCIRCWY